MKNVAMCLSVGLAFCAASSAFAEDGAPKDEQKLERAASDLDKAALKAEGPKEIESRLTSEFKVEDARVQGLRDQKLGYGEISIVLSLAEKRPGGITDANVAAIMAERMGPPKMGWGQIARKQGTTLGKLNEKLKRVGAPAGKTEKAHGKPENKPEKLAHPEKAERAERAAKPENPGHSKH